MQSSKSSESQPQRVALVTGAARGLGRAIALRLADDGLDVAVNDLPNMPNLDKVVEEIVAKGRRAIATRGDVSDEKVVSGMVQQTVRELGSLDVVCLQIKYVKRKQTDKCTPPPRWWPMLAF
jgi:NAD(P)-dependent dehydrogenase (short-subunit alcohol dehydrogenase family)